MTFPILLTRGPERIVALAARPLPPVAEMVAEETGPALSSEPAEVAELEASASVHAAERVEESAVSLTPSFPALPVMEELPIEHGPQDQPVVALRIPLSFRETATLSRSLYFTHYAAWMGRLREAALQPVYEALADQLASGQWGMVTNSAETHILGVAGPKDTVLGRLWVERLYGPANATMDLCFEWRRLLPGPDGASPGTRYETVALSRMSATWVAILDHGVVEARPFPPYLQGFMQRMAPAEPPLTDWGIDLARMASFDPGSEVLRVPAGPGNRAVLLEQQYDTALEDANLVGNIYFANYSVWQGRTVDRFFYDAAPELFRGTGQSGELRCTFTRIEHLREAMPFDRIAVRLLLGTIYTYGVQLNVEYFRVGAEGDFQKLAFGEYHGIWMAPADDSGRTQAGSWRPAPLPMAFRDALLRGAGVR